MIQCSPQTGSRNSCGSVRQKGTAVLIILTGMILMLYPWLSNWLYENVQESAAGSYNAVVETHASGKTRMDWENAEIYNEKLLLSNVVISDPFTYDLIVINQDLEYENLLNPDGTGIMCFIDIPKINVYLPVYHGTSPEVLAKGAGHVEGTALPIGTAGGRPVISAHTGVNTAKMFSDLTDMEEGDLFFIHVLDETLAYRVTGTEVIEPDDVSSVTAQEGRDLVTLMTCTPYGVNSHRLIVTGERTDYTAALQAEADAQEMGSGSEWMKAYRKALLAAFAMIACTMASGICVKRHRERKAGDAPGTGIGT